MSFIFWEHTSPVHLKNKIENISEMNVLHFSIIIPNSFFTEWLLLSRCEPPLQVSLWCYEQSPSDPLTAAAPAPFRLERMAWGIMAMVKWGGKRAFHRSWPAGRKTAFWKSGGQTSGYIKQSHQPRCWSSLMCSALTKKMCYCGSIMRRRENS